MKPHTGIALLLSMVMVSGVMAGPNAGGILVVHDTGLVYSTDLVLPPVSTPPASCGQVDTRAEPLGGVPLALPVWKVYAVFPPGSSPRLKGLSWGEGLSAIGGGGVVVVAAGLPNAADFELTQSGWPYHNGASIGMTFTSGTRTTLITECYWFAGYAYLGTHGEAQFFCVQPHVLGPPVFVDDSVPANPDPIEGWGCPGFGAQGIDPVSACCVYGWINGSLNHCVITTEAACRANNPGNLWGGALSCEPNPCTFVPAVQKSWGEIKSTYR